MSLIVVNYPAVSQRDFKWIQSIRQEHDELYYSVVDPHFTFVFPVFDVDTERFVEHVKEQAEGSQEIRFVCRCATVVNDATNEYTRISST